jgi:hypothetical protein
MTGAGNDTFEMHVTDGAERVSITLLVPVVDDGSEDTGSPDGWVVAHRWRGPDRDETDERPPQLGAAFNEGPGHGLTPDHDPTV